MENLSLIDFASEDDFLVSPANEGFLEATTSIEQSGCTHHLGSTTKEEEEETRTKVTGLNEEIPELCESPKCKSSKSGINLRKSLAWDSAFFTCEGVLNTEELGIINTTFGQTEKSTLAAIAEDARRSGESTTTLDTDNWTLESLESELFDNIRVSIQKSIGSSEKGPSPASGSLEKNKKKQGSNPSRLGSAKEKITKAPQNKIKVGRGEKKAACLPPKQPQASWKRASLDSKVMAAGGGGGGVQSKTASANAPRMLPKPTLSRTLSKTTLPPVNIQKRSSTESGLARKPVSKSSQGPTISTSRSMVGPPRCAPGAISGANKKTSSVASPSPKTKSPVFNTNKRPASSRTPTQASPKSKIGNSNKINSLTCLPSISPRSSIDSVRSTNTTESAGRGSPISLSGLTSSKDLVYGSLSRSSSSSSIASQDRSLKPSGLRMPSIKLGYFDGGKPVLNTNAHSFQKPGFFASPQINATTTKTAKHASKDFIEDLGVTSQRINCVEKKNVSSAIKEDIGVTSPRKNSFEKENVTPLNPSESSAKTEVNLLEERISSLSLSQV